LQDREPEETETKTATQKKILDLLSDYSRRDEHNPFYCRPCRISGFIHIKFRNFHAFNYLFCVQRHVASGKIAVHEQRNLHNQRSAAQYGALLRSTARSVNASLLINV